jgi:diaminopimelate decarboxylase
VAPRINKCIDELFPEKDIRIIGEPGTYICESAVYIVSRIIGTKKFERDNDEIKHYFINNGIYKAYMVR